VPSVEEVYAKWLHEGGQDGLVKDRWTEFRIQRMWKQLRIYLLLTLDEHGFQRRAITKSNTNEGFSFFFVVLRVRSGRL
jgi:hypothetical protein